MNEATRKAMHSSKTDEWSTPQDFFDVLNQEFDFGLDAAATAENAKCPRFYSAEFDSLRCCWLEPVLHRERKTVWCNPPYSRLAEFLAKAAAERLIGVTTVMLIPSRTDTKAFHEHVWDREKHQPREGVQIRPVKGRLKFGGSKNSAPFPSTVVVFRPTNPQ